MRHRVRGSKPWVLTLAVLTMAVCASGVVPAQVTPAKASTPPDDTPFVKVGGVLFADYTYYDKPDDVYTDAAGQTYKYSAFEITRAYINVTGNVHHLLSYRITPDIARSTDRTTDLPTGEYRFRLKFAYLQFNMDDWLPKGSWVKLGMQQTPYIDYVDTISRYRFQGPAFTDRQKLLSSADTGLVARIAYPKDYGDAQFGFYNGESYTASEANNEKSFQMRLSVRPGASVPILKGWRLAFFKDWDATMDHAVRDRTAWNTTFEHKWVNAGYEYVIAEDQALPTDPATRFQGYSVWVTPKLPLGFEIYARYDFAIPDMSQPARVTETIAGLAYWLPVQKGVSTAILLDYDRTIDQRPDHWEVRRYTLHAMVQF